jgi:hypothetical protein
MTYGASPYVLLPMQDNVPAQTALQVVPTVAVLTAVVPIQLRDVDLVWILSTQQQISVSAFRIPMSVKAIVRDFLLGKTAVLMILAPQLALISA